MVSLAIDGSLDLPALAAAFASRRRVRIPGFLDAASAGALAQDLARRSDWVRVIMAGANVHETTPAAYAAMSAEQRSMLETAIYAEAARGFRFRYDTIRVPDAPAERAVRRDPLTAFARLMSRKDTLRTLARITGDDDLAFADAQATRFRRGDFLNRHDDHVPGKNRRLAYVLGLTPAWPPEWGGLLLFNDAAGGIDAAIAPAFNALSLFAVPQAHSVSAIAPYADGERISVTGWLRTVAP